MPSASNIRRTSRFSFGQFQFDEAAAVVDGEESGFFRLQLFAGLKNALENFRQHLRLDAAFHGDVIGLAHAVARMGELEAKIAVVGQEDQTLAVVVEPSDGKRFPHSLGSRSPMTWCLEGSRVQR